MLDPAPKQRVIFTHLLLESEERLHDEMAQEIRKN